MNNEFNVDKADKDELLDYTAQNGIEADYTMTVRVLRRLIKDFMFMQTARVKVKGELSELQRQEKVRTIY